MGLRRGGSDGTIPGDGIRTELGGGGGGGGGKF